jgi:hypothetical protein
MSHRIALVLAALTLSACGSQPPPPVATPTPVPPPTVSAPPAPATSAGESSAPAAPVMSGPIDEKAVADATGVDKPEKAADGSVKVSFPRKDVDVSVDGWKMPAFMGLTSWAAFAPARKDVAEAMVMGDLVLFEDEVNPVMSKLLDAGVQVTALHNHFFFDQPHVYFMHVGGEGKVVDLGKGVRSAMDVVAAIRKKSPKPTNTFGAAKLPAKSAIDGAKLDSVLNTKGTSKDGMYKAVWGRETSAACGCPVGKAMGVNTWAAFAGADDNAVVDGDFAVSESELQSVLRSLRAGGINVVAIHHHMSGEEPRILFLHYWGRGKAADLGATVKKTIDLTAWSGKGK